MLRQVSVTGIGVCSSFFFVHKLCEFLILPKEAKVYENKSKRSGYL
jgi:hypothetical protein